jgi:UDP-N-acetylmuramate--alanine ligase
MDAFGPALRDADEIVLTDIYAAGEEPIAGVSIDALADAVRRGSGRPVHVAKEFEAVIPQLLRIVRPGDAVLTLGAGSIGSLPPRLIEALGNADLSTAGRDAPSDRVASNRGDNGPLRTYDGERSDG